MATVLNQAYDQGRLTQSGLFIAKGVGNPNPLPDEEYRRESDSLSSLSKDPRAANQRVIYFSTLSIDSPSRYAEHKRHMEELIARLFPKFIIARLGILVGVNINRFTTVNFLHDKVSRGEPVRIRETSRDVVDADRLVRQINNFDESSGVVEIHGQTMTERQIFEQFVLAPLGISPPYEHETR